MLRKKRSFNMQIYPGDRLIHIYGASFVHMLLIGQVYYSFYGSNARGNLYEHNTIYLSKVISNCVRCYR